MCLHWHEPLENVIADDLWIGDIERNALHEICTLNCRDRCDVWDVLVVNEFVFLFGILSLAFDDVGGECQRFIDDFNLLHSF